MTSDNYRLGYTDGAEAARESGTSHAPAEGWDGWLVNSVGPTEAARLLDVKGPEGHEWEAALAEYAAGAQAGANAELGE